MTGLLVGLIPIVFIGAAVVAFVVMRGLRRSAPNAGDGNGKRIPLVASFSSIRGAGPFGGGHNNLNPLLLLHEDGLEYRVFRRKTAAYAGIREVDAAGTRIILAFADSAFTFTGNTGDVQVLADAMRFLRDKGCPLTARAAAIADTPPA